MKLPPLNRIPAIMPNADALAEAKAQRLEEQKRVALLNAQLRELRSQLGSVQALLDEYEQRDSEKSAQITELGERLNQALAREASDCPGARSD